ncbi:unnamed protein product, partial [Polarella glacialis]
SAGMAFVGKSVVALFLLVSSQAVEASPASATKLALRALDTDGSGQVEASEIDAFAQTQGLAGQKVRAAFRSLDTNGNGILEENEIESVLAADGAEGFPRSTAPEPVVQDAADEVDEEPAALPAAPAAEETALVQEDKAAAFLNIKALDAEAVKKAGHVMATVFEKQAAAVLATHGEETSNADALEETARSFRGQADAIRKSAAEQVAQAAKTASERVLKQASKQVKLMETEISAALKNAALSHRLAEQAMTKALAAQSKMSEQMQRIKNELQ